MPNYDKISSLNTINDTDSKKVADLVKSMLDNGYIGAPIIYTNMGLVTGSHRLMALHTLNNMLDDCDDDTFTKICDILNNVAIFDATDIMNDYCEKNDCTFDEIDFAFLGDIFAGTELEQYKNQITEW